MSSARSQPARAAPLGAPRCGAPPARGLPGRATATARPSAPSARARPTRKPAVAREPSLCARRRLPALARDRVRRPYLPSSGGVLAPPSQGTCTLEGESNRGGGRNLTLGTSPPAGAFSACCCCTGFAAAPRGGAAAPPHHRPTASWAASAPPQRPARALAAPPRLHFAAAIHRCAAAPRASPEPLYGAMSRLGCRRGCAGAPPARRDATAAACVVSLTSPARASASQTRASPLPGAITGTAAAARAAPAAPPAPPGDAGRYPAAVATLPTAGAPPPPPPSALRP